MESRDTTYTVRAVDTKGFTIRSRDNLGSDVLPIVYQKGLSDIDTHGGGIIVLDKDNQPLSTNRLSNLRQKVSEL